jgi:succinate dehydrogenase flavin-adding protein (antitoxin of CptAB toxin-antitoxin module)
MNNFEILKEEKPTKLWKKRMPLFTRWMLSRGVNEIDMVLNEFIRELESLEGDNSREKILGVVERTIYKLNDIDMKRQIIETLEREDLCEFIDKGARLAGLQIEKKDITEDYRNW